MRRWLVAVVFLGVALLSGGCGGSHGCDASVQRAIEVFVFDAQTKAPAAEGAVATIGDGNYVETLREVIWTYPDSPGATSTPLALGGAYERPGTYTVRVEKAGYEPWEVTGVRVRKGDCHVERARLEAYLKRSE